MTSSGNFLPPKPEKIFSPIQVQWEQKDPVTWFPWRQRRGLPQLCIAPQKVIQTQGRPKNLIFRGGKRKGRERQEEGYDDLLFAFVCGSEKHISSRTKG
ncbi:hypothetical protein SKAU_G00364720 [Synaphobranchus kaupii]|uniref:Uncharacterized protein n=1 Tax=Synaphobranchus kaupii TaxID=118154 RepID=A0A9Q1EEV0_SYNKA|nr:hypothetical protein SKAU_G00364720 [Synaphobranchus kaupii]